jgi:glycine cleavage system H protein
MNIPKNLFYTKSHEWVKKNDDGTAYVGLTDFAQSELGDLVYVNLPQEGDVVTVEESFADVESVKAVSDVYSPVSGTVEAVNEELLDAPQLINETPYDAWFIKVSDISAEAEFLSAEEYEAFISG